MSLTDVAAEAASAGEAPVKSIEGRSPWQLAWMRLRKDRVAMISLGVIVALFLIAILAPAVASLTGHAYDQQLRDTGWTRDGQPVGPNSEFWLGTDSLARDILVRAVYGARVSLTVGVVSTALATLLGIVLGLLAGFFGGWVDTVISRGMDIVLAFPFVLVALVLATALGPSVTMMVIVISFFNFAAMGRIVRGQTLSIREKEYVEAARSLGASNMRIMFTDVLPNITAPVIVLATLLIPQAIVFEATLSFLGAGVDPRIPSWGGMLNEAQGGVFITAWWYLVVPGVLLLVTTLAFNLFGDSLRDALDPRSERLFAKAGKGK
jgi:ABC-type dipeptide/oligopeptide/nickel transport system permease subunit